MRSKWPTHKRVRIWWAPWRTRCQCGMAAYPCPAMRLGAVKRWQAEERMRHDAR